MNLQPLVQCQVAAVCRCIQSWRLQREEQRNRFTAKFCTAGSWEEAFPFTTADLEAWDSHKQAELQPCFPSLRMWCFEHPEIGITNRNSHLANFTLSNFFINGIVPQPSWKCSTPFLRWCRTFFVFPIYVCFCSRSPFVSRSTVKTYVCWQNFSWTIKHCIMMLNPSSSMSWQKLTTLAATW